MIDREIQIKIDQFDGPFSLLLHLLEKNEMKVRDLSINDITKQYLDYLDKMRELNFDIAGDYLFMAATLLYLKSQDSILEGNEEALFSTLLAEDQNMISKTDLIKRLEELSRFQSKALDIWKLEKLGHEIFTRPKINRKIIANSLLSQVELSKLTSTMVDLMRKEKKKFFVQKRDRISIKEKLSTLKNLLRPGEKFTFSTILENTQKEIGSMPVYELVITFISMLELARLKKVSIFQNDDGGEIYIDVLDSLDNFDVNEASGFDTEEEKDNSSDENVADLNISSVDNSQMQ